MTCSKRESLCRSGDQCTYRAFGELNVARRDSMLLQDMYLEILAEEEFQLRIDLFLRWHAC